MPTERSSRLSYRPSEPITARYTGFYKATSLIVEGVAMGYTDTVSKAREVLAHKFWELLHDECRDGCVLGIGTGTTIEFMLSYGVRRGYVGLLRRCILFCSSIRSEMYLRKIGLKAASLTFVDDLDIYVDSADEVDDRKYMIKGGGGAMLREKVLCSLSRKKYFFVDFAKRSAMIGEKKFVPIEIEYVALPLLAKFLALHGYRYEVRNAKAKYGPIMTDNNNLIVDVYTGALRDPETFDREIASIPGVVTTGIFTPKHVTMIFVGYPDRLEIID